MPTAELPHAYPFRLVDAVAEPRDEAFTHGRVTARVTSNARVAMGEEWGTPILFAEAIAQAAGFTLPAGTKFIIVPERHIGKQYPFSSEKLSPVLAIFRYSGFDNALGMARQIFEVGGKGHSCGIYSFNPEHIHRLALIAPVSRIMVRQPQVRGNAGSFTNGMPMTASLGCGTWGGNITCENISVKHFMNTTWVSQPIPEDKPSEQEIFGRFYNTEIFETRGPEAHRTLSVNAGLAQDGSKHGVGA